MKNMSVMVIEIVIIIVIVFYFTLQWSVIGNKTFGYSTIRNTLKFLLHKNNLVTMQTNILR
jgi:hypothetical protein